MQIEQRLVRDRAQTRSRLAGLTADLASLVDASDGDNADDEHDPEGATIGYERAQLLGDVERTTEQLARIGVALARLDDGTYGTCTACAGPIGADRLDARPTATTCITCASA